ncbi:MAG: AlkA N-terminal domain-containing protein [Pseudomonadota bacterium]
MTGAAVTEIALPPHYRWHDVLAFHRRDTESVAEHVTPRRIRKGVLVDGVAVEIGIEVDPACEYARCGVRADAPLSDAARARVDEALRNMLGLRIEPQALLALTEADPLMGPLVRRRPGLRIVQSASAFEALTWAIIGQQINLPFAIALRRSLILQTGRRHSAGLWCYPEAADVARLAPESLTAQKFSRAKADTLLRLARLVQEGALSLALPASGEVEALAAALLAVKGIGPWTVNYALLRGYGYADCSLHGDVAIRSALQRLLGEPDKPDLARTEAFLAQYKPQRSMAAAHLWASLQPPAPD